MSLPETMKAIVNMREGDNLTFGVREIPTPTITNDKDVIIKMEAAPINPSDMGAVGPLAKFAGGPENMSASGPGQLSTPLPEAAMGAFEEGKVVACGNEGCGTVVAAGADPAAQALIGKRVAATLGGAYAQYAKYTLGVRPMEMFTELPEDVSALEGASVFVNPLTVVGFVHTLRADKFKGIVHTAAGSQLGRMLVKHCKEEGVPLVNIVRSRKAAQALQALGAEYVVRQDSETFTADLLEAVKATGANLGFDATGGGELACAILGAFEQALIETGSVNQSFYGPPEFRQLYRYGGLDRNDTRMPMSLGVGNWGYGGWLMPFHFAKYGPEHLQGAIEKAVKGLKTTFTTAYGKHLALDDMCASPESYLESLTSKTDDKFLVTPNGAL